MEEIYTNIYRESRGKWGHGKPDRPLRYRKQMSKDERKNATQDDYTEEQYCFHFVTSSAGAVS